MAHPTVAAPRVRVPPDAGARRTRLHLTPCP
ncbi:hypothetical protein SAMN04488546_0607 [Geodermatophilus poikilotrophus]|uniref:Uncharacterized protein n=1 Tax=Geodermatophilus poikilotrophus TaxID=1333667 RepID=A0A1H9ZI99_9ACTN|nr:hypothetical protein SAMN04488546_0607 [Geodermatophilus poikilotrophus]